MFIVTADRDAVLNMDNINTILLRGKQIVAVTKVEDYVIGTYKDSERANKVFKNLLTEGFPNIGAYCGSYYMPEE